MEDLLLKSNIDVNKLKKVLTSSIGEELSKLSEPCYYPSVKKYYFQQLDAVGLKEPTIREYFKKFYENVPAADALLKQDPANNLLIFIIFFFLKNKDINSALITIVYYNVRQYGALIRRQIPYCKPEFFKYALDNVAKTHLFSREKTIPSAIIFLSREAMRRWGEYIGVSDAENIGKFINEVRTRLAQSIKSFAESYYYAAEKGLGIRTPYEGEDEQGETFQVEVLDKIIRVAENVSKQICVYKKIDNNAREDAKKITRVKDEVTNLIVRELNNTKYIDNIKIIVELFLRDLKNKSQLCGTDFLPFVNSLMSIKRTTKQIYFKQQVNVLTELIIDGINYRERYDTLTSQSRYYIQFFVGLYISIVTRHIICGDSNKPIRVGSFKI